MYAPYTVHTHLIENFLEMWVLDKLKDVAGEIPEKDSGIFLLSQKT